MLALSGPRQIRQDPTQREWENLITPDQKKPVDTGSKTERPTFDTMDQVVQAARGLDFHPLDPFVATVASGMDARSVDEPGGREKLQVSVEDFYDEPLELEAGFENGPEAPMMVILPGIFGDSGGGYTTAFKKIAYERGMNYTVIDNPLGEDMMGEKPKRHPGNIQTEAEAMHAVLNRLREKKPEYFDNVTLAGYSYGALLAANVARFDEAQSEVGPRVIQGGVVAVSPPENLYHSMQQLDGLREGYKEGAGSVTGTALSYKKDLAFLGYERFMESSLAQRGEGTNITEIKISDSYGSRNGMKDMVVRVDDQFEHDQLPPTFPDYFERRRVLNNMTYAQYSDEWFSKDPWMVANGLTAEKLADNNTYSLALEKLEETPVLTLVSEDDYILKAEDVQTLSTMDVDDTDLEYTQMMAHGGHVGVLFNPEIQNFLGDFAYSSAGLKASKAPA